MGKNRPEAIDSVLADIFCLNAIVLQWAIAFKKLLVVSLVED